MTLHSTAELVLHLIQKHLPSAERPQFAIVGLGNPGEEYARTRHNVGFMVIDEIGQQMGVTLEPGHGQYRAGAIVIDGKKVLLVKPATFMNESGIAVRQVVQHYELDLGNLLLVHDDIDLPFGRLRLRPSGSSAGHRGVLSVITALGSQNFPRLRIGIGRPAQGDVRDYVLSPFDREEERALDKVLKLACAAAVAFVVDGIEKAMGVYNRAEL